MMSSQTNFPAKIALDSKSILSDTNIVLSPLKYFGNRGHKQEDIFYLINLHRGGKKYKCCYDLFAGYGSMTLAALSFDIADAYVMNGLYPPLQIFWEQVKFSPKALIARYSDLLKKYLHSNKPSAFYARCQAHFNAITKHQKPVQDLTHYAVLFAFLINHAERGMPPLSVDLTLQCKRSVQLPGLWSGQKEFKEAVLKVSHLFNKHNVSFTSQDFSKMTTITQNDVVLLDPPYPDMKNTKEKPKHPLSEQLKDYIEKLEKKGTSFLMFYGVLGMQNTCPIVYPQGHVLRLSGSATGPFQYYVEHLYVSPLLVPYIQQAQSQFPDRIQPCFPRLFETHAQCGEYKNGNKVALAWGESAVRTRTYAEVNASANVLANYLQHRLGKKSEALIAVYLERGPALFITLMAVMKADAAFLPLEADTKRLSIHASYKRIQQSGADGLIISSELWENLKKLNLDEKETPIDWSKLIVIDLDQATYEELVFTPEKLQAKWTIIPDEKPCSLPIIQPTQLAYVMYTSGSTGTPKGVEILHRGLPYAFTSHQDLLNLGPGDRVLQFASIGFDASLMEMMMAWGAGGSLYLANKAQFEDAEALTQFINVNKITVAIQTPKMLGTLKPEEFPDLRSILIVGDAFEKKLSDQWLYRKTSGGNFKRDVVNGYGLTETTICTTLELCDEKKALTIGKPILGVEVYLRQLEAEEKELALAPGQWIAQKNVEEKKESALGTLYVTGPCVAKGYWKEPRLTEQRFKLFSSNGIEQVLYKTGDVGCYTADGRIIFKNRIDRQVKIRGQRVELEEIERQILKYVKEVQEVRVLAVPDRTDKALVAYLVPKTDYQDLVITGQEPSARSLDSLINILKVLESNILLSMCPALSHMKWVKSLPKKENDKNSYDDKEIASWPVPCLKLGKKEVDIKFEATLSVQEKNLLHWLRAIWIKILNIISEDLISYSVTFKEYGGDSIKTKQFIGYVNEKIKRGEQPQWTHVLKKMSANYLLNVNLRDLVVELTSKNKGNIQDAKAFRKVILNSSLPLDEKIFSMATGISNDKIIKTFEGCWIYALDKKMLEIKGLPIYVIHSLLGDAEFDYQSSVVMRETKVNYTLLNTPSLEEEKNHFSSSSLWIDRLIDYHLAKVRKEHDRGPYWFIGWSSGGWIAKLVASRLRKEGERVFVFLLDTECPKLLQSRRITDSHLVEIGEKIKGSISLCMEQSFPKLSFVVPFLSTDPVTLSRQFFEGALQEFTALRKGFHGEYKTTKLDRAEKLIRSAQKIYEAELEYKGSACLDEDDFLLVAEIPQKKTSYAQNILGWEVKENNVAYVKATHFDLLDKIQTCEIIEKKLSQQFKTLHMPYFSALAHTLQKEDEKAIKAWNEVTKLDANNEAAYFLRARCKLKIKDYRGVVKDTTALIKLNANQVDAYIFRGEANRFLKNYSEVIKDANAVIARDNKRADAYYLRAKAKFALNYGKAGFNSSYWNDAIDDATKAITLDPQNPHFYILRGSLKLLVLKDYTGVINDMTQVIHLDKTIEIAYLLSAKAHFGLGKYLEIIGDMNQLIDLNANNVKAYFLRGQAKIVCENFHGATNDLDQVIQRGAGDASVYSMYGFAKYFFGELEHALKAFSKATQLDSTDTLAYFYIAEIKIKKNDYQGALEVMNQCVKLNKKNAMAYMLRASIYESCEKFKNAINDFNQSIKLDGSNAQTYIFRGMLKSKQKDHQGASDDFAVAALYSNCEDVEATRLLASEEKKMVALQKEMLALKQQISGISSLLEVLKQNLPELPDVPQNKYDAEFKKMGTFYNPNKFTKIEKQEFRKKNSEAFGLIHKLYPNADTLEHKNAKAKAEKMQLKDLAQLKAWVDTMREELRTREGPMLAVRNR